MDYSVNSRPLLNSDDEESNDGSEEDIPHHGNSSELQPFETPTDWYRLGYVTFYLLGIVTLLPYTFFVTAHDYWLYKLRDTSISKSDNENMTSLQKEFTSYLTIAATWPSVIIMFLNSVYAHRISIELRMFGSLFTILGSFVLTTVLAVVNTDSWQLTFFAVTIVTVVIINIMGSILQACIFGIACKISTRYLSAVVSGQALGGIFPAVVYIGSLSLGASATHSALLYFNIANFVLALSLLAYYLLSQSLFFKFHLLVKPPANTLQYDPADGDDGGTLLLGQISVTQVFFKVWPYAVASMITYVITMSVYPSITVLISSEDVHSDWTDKYFVPVISFLLFSMWDYAGRVVAGYLKWPLQRPWVTLGFSLLRAVCIPAFLLCNAQPRDLLPVLIHSDSGYIAIMCLFGLSNGYMTNITLINAPRVVGIEEQEVATSLVSFFISCGCATGALLSVVLLRIL